MSNRNTIPTPWSHRFRRFSQTALPFIGFAATVVLTGWLWHRGLYLPNATGEVEALRIDVTSYTDGILAPLAHLEGGQWSLFDRVNRKEVIAQLDDSTIRASLATMQAELAQLRAEIDAEQARLALDDSTRKLDIHRERARLAWQMEGDRLDALDRQLLIEADRIEHQRLETQLKYWEQVETTRIVPEQVLVDTRLQRDKLAKQIKTNQLALEEIGKQLESIEASFHALPAAEEGNEAAILAPLKASISVQESLISGLHVEIDHLNIRAPISGTIAAIYKHPGQAITAGDPILTIASEEGRYIVSYLRGHHVEPRIGTPVQIRQRTARTSLAESTIQRVGPQVEPIPAHHLIDPTIQEWGLPIRVSIPPDFPVRPGELVDLSLIPDRG